ncbi:MAG: hypothetical protein QE485_04240 [Acidovorax sp.]|uniref:hypothetical protein n=1 Tax=Acidovorax sp. TaxID=1872122 RepID=UPI0026375482|nr:hypothetical protein [Acidovorax sp.]MDH4416412.1 hypothetical protein [Acidovorax sp.]
MIKIKSYGDINGVPFGGFEAEIIAKFGQPIRQTKNRENEKELHFSTFILRLDANSNQLRECTLTPECRGQINDKEVMWNEGFLQWMASEDKNLMEAFGFIISFKLGIAVTGFHDGDVSQMAIHAFRKNDWDAFLKRMKPFRI